VGVWQNNVSAGWYVNIRNKQGNNILYYFRAAVNNNVAYEVQLGATMADTANNLLHAINDDGTGKGTLYSNATTAHPEVTASLNGTTLYITAKVAGYWDGYQNVNCGCWPSAFISWAVVSGWLWGGGKYLKSAKTPQGLQMIAHVFNGNNTTAWAYIRPMGVELTPETRWANLPINTAGFRYHLIANKYQFFLYPYNSNGSRNNNVFACGVPYLPEQTRGLVVSGASNTSPISITTSTAHNYTTGTQVFIAGVEGNTAANGQWFITVTGGDTFTLDGSTGNGGWTAGSGLVGEESKTISRCIWASMEDRTSNFVTNVGYNITVINGAFTSDSLNGPDFQIFDRSYNNHYWWGQRAVLSEPLLSFGFSTGADREWYGQLWDAVIVNRRMTLELETSFDGHDWRQWINHATQSLWLVVP
jgi:hypothetical protein